MRRWLVTRELNGSNEWEFASYRCWIIDAADPHGAGVAYVDGVEAAAREIHSRYPDTASEPWDGDGRPSAVGVVPMVEIGSFRSHTGPDRKHRAEAFDSLWEFERVQTVSLTS